MLGPPNPPSISVGFDFGAGGKYWPGTEIGLQIPTGSFLGWPTLSVRFFPFSENTPIRKVGVPDNTSLFSWLAPQTVQCLAELFA